MIDILLLKQSEPNVISPTKGDIQQSSYFDQITQRLDSWEVNRLSISQRRAQLIKTMLIEETDPTTNITRTFRLSCELISTEQANVNVDALELPALSTWEMEGNEYVS